MVAHMRSKRGGAAGKSRRPSARAAPLVRRGFVDIEEGQVHYRSCGNRGNPPLVMLHYSPGSSYSLMPLALAFAEKRWVIALDSLGNGDSSPPARKDPKIPYYANAHWRALKKLGIEVFDLYGYHTGASMAIEIAIAAPESVRKMILDGVSLFSPQDLDRLMGNDHAPQIPVDQEGTQLQKCWMMVRDAHFFFPWWDRRPEAWRDHALPSAEYLHGEVLEVLKAVSTYHLTYRAALTYDKRVRAPLVKTETLVTASRDDPLSTMLDEAAALIPGARKLLTAGWDGDEPRAETAKQFLAFLGDASATDTERA
jgi:pimeloyl-ACP methyl ester carboxylesterase